MLAVAVVAVLLLVVVVVVCGAVIDSVADAGGLGDDDSGGDDDGESSSPSAFLRSVRGDVEPETVDAGDRLPRIVIDNGTLVSLMSRSMRFA